MKKVFLIFLCLAAFAGCDNIVLRKDKSERVTFNTQLAQGEYTLYLYEMEYPKMQKEKLVFFSQFENFLRTKSVNKEEYINFIMPKSLYDDVEAIINDEGIGNERAFFKSASFINEEDKKIIDKEAGFVKTQSNGGEIQEYLNKQYYHILSLIGKQADYKENFFYTEYDKRTITFEYLKERKSLKEILIEKKKDFIVELEDIQDIKNYSDDMIYLKNSNDDTVKDIFNDKIEISSPIVIVNSKNYTGYTVKNGTVIFFNNSNEKGKKEELNYFRRYNFVTEIKKISDFDYSNFAADEKQTEISVLLGREKYVPKRPLI